MKIHHSCSEILHKLQYIQYACWHPYLKSNVIRSIFTASTRTTAWLNLILSFLLIMPKFEAYIGHRLSGILSSQACFLSTNICRSSLIAVVIGVRFPAVSIISDTLVITYDTMSSFNFFWLVDSLLQFSSMHFLWINDSLFFLGIDLGNHFISATLMLTLSSSSVIFSGGM